MKRFVQIEWCGEVLLQIGFKGLRESLQAIQNMIRCRMPQAAMRMALNQMAELFYLNQILRCAPAIGNFIQIVFEQLGAYPAGGAKTTTFMRKKAGKITVDCQQIALLSKD